MALQEHSASQKVARARSRRFIEQCPGGEFHWISPMKNGAFIGFSHDKWCFLQGLSMKHGDRMGYEWDKKVFYHTENKNE